MLHDWCRPAPKLARRGARDLALLRPARSWRSVGMTGLAGSKQLPWGLAGAACGRRGERGQPAAHFVWRQVDSSVAAASLRPLHSPPRPVLAATSQALSSTSAHTNRSTQSVGVLALPAHLLLLDGHQARLAHLLRLCQHIAVVLIQLWVGHLDLSSV